MADDQSDQNIESSENNDDDACEVFQDGQLSFIGHDVDTIPQKLINEYSKVTRRLDLSFNNISQLTGLQEFCNLEELVLDSNAVNDTTVFPSLAQLHTLTLNKNKLSNLEGLLNNLEENFPKLKYLSLLGNMACPNQLSSHDKDDEDYHRYRYQVLYRLPNLKFLDSSQVRKSDLEEAKRVGPYMTVVRGSIPNEKMPEETSPSTSPQYSPLPTSLRTGDDHQGTFGKSKYVYYGKHSEGNRFIRNNDL